MLKKEKLIKYGSHYLDKQDIKNVTETLASNYLTQGPKVDKFENSIKKFLNVKNVISCSSGTSAIHLALLSLNLKPKKIIIMPVINFVSAYNVSKNLNYQIYFADIDKDTGLVTPQNILECIKKNKLKKIDVLFVMHHGGHVCDLKNINHIKKKYKFKIIEDACHAFGSSYTMGKKKLKVGCGLHSDITIFSFHAIKVITTGEGGALVTNNNKIASYAKLLRSHGIKRTNLHWRYDVYMNGLNYRLSDIAASLGLSQLKKIKKFIKYRQILAKNYFNLLKKYKDIISLPQENFLNFNSWHLFTVKVNFKKIKLSKISLFKFMLKKNIILQQHYIPIVMFKTESKNNKFVFKNSNSFYENSFSLPIHFHLRKVDQTRVIKNLITFIKKENK